MRARRDAGLVRAPQLRRAGADAPAAVDHARASASAARSRCCTRSSARAWPRWPHAASANRINALGPIGNGFVPHRERPRTLLVGGGVGIPPMVFLAERLREDTATPWKPLVLMGSEIPFPFRARPSTILVPGMPDGVDRLHAAARRVGHPQPPHQPRGLCGLPRRLRDRSGGRVARLARSRRRWAKWRCSRAGPRRC